MNIIILHNPGRPISNTRGLKQLWLTLDWYILYVVSGVVILHVCMPYCANTRTPCVQPQLIIHKGWKKRGGNCLLCLNVVMALNLKDQGARYSNCVLVCVAYCSWIYRWARFSPWLYAYLCLCMHGDKLNSYFFLASCRDTIGCSEFLYTPVRIAEACANAFSNE